MGFDANKTVSIKLRLVYVLLCKFGLKIKKNKRIKAEKREFFENEAVPIDLAKKFTADSFVDFFEL